MTDRLIIGISVALCVVVVCFAELGLRRSDARVYQGDAGCDCSCGVRP